MSTHDQANDRPEAILAVRLPADLRDSLRSEAEAHQRSMSGQVRWLIENSLLSHTGDEATSEAAADDCRRQAA